MDTPRRSELVAALVRMSVGYERALDLGESLLRRDTPSSADRAAARSLLALQRAHLTSERVSVARLLGESAHEDAQDPIGASRPFP